jgi:hypothetical protein
MPRQRSPHLWLVERISRLLLADLPFYERHVPNDLGNLRRSIRKGDVILVEGRQRISLIIKYLTQSLWSHCVLYVGDEPLRRDLTRRDELVRLFGEDAEHLVVEALPEGVVLSPLSKYVDLNIRVCRPYNLRKEDCVRVIDDVLSRVGHRYDVKNIVDLARYFFPVSLIPRRFRRKVMTLGSGEPTEVICSRMIAEAFHRVGFPVQPRVIVDPNGAAPRGFFSRLLRRVPERIDRYYRRPTVLITPRDFDLSPYFEIVKFNFIEQMKFDYRKIRWVEEDRDKASG